MAGQRFGAIDHRSLARRASKGSREVRGLIVRMYRENFLWGAPRIHGELLMLGFRVSQANVSRYLPAPSRRPTQSRRTFLRNQAMTFGHREYAEELSRADAGLQGQSYWADLMQSAAAQIAIGQQQLIPNAERVSCDPLSAIEA